MNVLKLAAFLHNGQSGNSAGVAFCDEMPSDEIGESVAVSGKTRYISE